jgi:hypothetical protein
VTAPWTEGGRPFSPNDGSLSSPSFTLAAAAAASLPLSETPLLRQLERFDVICSQAREREEKRMEEALPEEEEEVRESREQVFEDGEMCFCLSLFFSLKNSKKHRTLSLSRRAALPLLLAIEGRGAAVVVVIIVFLSLSPFQA